MSTGTDTTASTTSTSIAKLVEERPTSHPLPFSIRHLGTDGILAPPRHLRDWYQHIWEAVYKPHTPKNLALLGPRNYAKTVSTINVAPAWLAVNFPQIRMAIVSHKKTHADKRAKTAVASIEEACERYGVPVYDSSKTTLQLEAGTQNIEPTLEPLSIRTSDTGSHYDVIIYDDIATLTNQTTALRSQNLGELRGVLRQRRCEGRRDLPPPQVAEHRHRDAQDARGRLPRARPCDEQPGVGRLYRPGDLPPRVGGAHLAGDAGLARHRERDLRRPRHGRRGVRLDPGRAGGRRDNRRRDPAGARHGVPDAVARVRGARDAAHEGRLEGRQRRPVARGEPAEPRGGHRARPRSRLAALRRPDPRDDWSALEWYAGLDFANPNNVAAEERGETDYWALAVYAYDRDNDQEYAVDVWRDRGYMWEEAATDFVGVHLSDYPVGELLVESNFDGKEIAETIEDNVDIRVTPSNSEGEKEQRLTRLANRFQQGKVKVASEENERWESFIREEWLPFPDAAHDDRFDALEIASRGPNSSVDHASSDEFDHIDWG
ncbi:hypothetical protein [Halorubrum sp. AS12]|uniref:hypothetical protein n=1 Tax=Halorubrum sp. AS12 TaxID=3409687 RepID=UPI003DA76F83